MLKIFLETHNIKNRAGGLGTFNYQLLKAIEIQKLDKDEITINLPNSTELKNTFSKSFKILLYTSLQRHFLFRIKKKFDIWHSLNQNTKVEPFFKPKKYILTVHDVNFVEEISFDKNHKINKLFAEKLKRADVITYISEFAKKQTHDYFDVPKVPEHIIYNGNPVENCEIPKDYQPDYISDLPYFYTIGDFIERKNFHSLVEMMRLLPNYNLIISGNNNKEYGENIKNLIAKFGIKNVILTGKVSEESKLFYMKNCTAFLFPSIREGFGLPPIEAMYFGKPVFLSDQTSLPEIGGNAAYYWTNFEPEYMKKVLLEGLQSFENEGINAVERVKKRAAFFSWEKAAAAYLKLYEI